MPTKIGVFPAYMGTRLATTRRAMQLMHGSGWGEASKSQQKPMKANHANVPETLAGLETGGEIPLFQ